MLPQLDAGATDAHQGVDALDAPCSELLGDSLADALLARLGCRFLLGPGDDEGMFDYLAIAVPASHGHADLTVRPFQGKELRHTRGSVG